MKGGFGLEAPHIGERPSGDGSFGLGWRLRFVLMGFVWSFRLMGFVRLGWVLVGFLGREGFMVGFRRGISERTFLHFFGRCTRVHGDERVGVRSGFFHGFRCERGWLMGRLMR